MSIESNGKVVRHACEPPRKTDIDSYFYYEPIFKPGTVWECNCGKQWIVKGLAPHPEWKRKWFKVTTKYIYH